MSTETHSYNKNMYNIDNIDTNKYIFELVLKDTNDNNIIIRKIKKTNKGNIISQNDKILFNSIYKYKLTIINLNNIDKSIIIKNDINKNKPKIIFNNNDIYLEINQTPSKLIEFRYVIN